MAIQLSDHFDYGRLIRFTLPSIAMMIFTSIYSVVDGFFISNFTGIIPFAAINLVFPFAQMMSCFGFMFGSGGTALVAATLGARQKEKAAEIFSMLVYIGIAVGVCLAVPGILFLEPICRFMGADDAMLPYCLIYGRILLAALPAFMLQNMFQSFLIAAEKPALGLKVTVAAGLTNIFLDWLFIVVLDWGIPGAAAATALAQCVGGIIPLVYFLCPNSSLLKLGKFRFDLTALKTSCTNGLSELVTNISMSLGSMLYNLQLMKFAGSNGVAAFGAVMYVSFMFVAVFLGYSIGAAPVIGFHYGAGDHGELKGLFRKSNVLVLASGTVLAAVAFGLARPLAWAFVGADEELLTMTVTAFRFYAPAVFFSGFNIFASAFFTALNNGIISAVISFLRTLVFQIAAVLILPLIWGVNGIWSSLFVSEMLASGVAVLLYIRQREKYHY